MLELRDKAAHTPKCPNRVCHFDPLLARINLRFNFQISNNLDETEVVSERKKRAPEELEDQIAVESQAVDSEQEHPIESKVSETLAHYTHPYFNGVKRLVN